MKSWNYAALLRTLNSTAQIVAVGMALSLAVLDAQSASARTAAEEQQACMGDVMKFCSAAIPDTGRIVSCLKRERSKISPACRAVISSR